MIKKGREEKGSTIDDEIVLVALPFEALHLHFPLEKLSLYHQPQ